MDGKTIGNDISISNLPSGICEGGSICRAFGNGARERLREGGYKINADGRRLSFVLAKKKGNGWIPIIPRIDGTIEHLII